MYGEEDYEDEEVAAVQEEGEEVTMIQLKGHKWPGMGMFDAANEAQRKMRNQKKPQSVIDQMRCDSEAVQRTELVFNRNMDQERTRDVYQEPSIYSGSPVGRNSAHRQDNMLTV
jgi:hypothetical protein